jgi:hypothetical protein
MGHKDVTIKEKKVLCQQQQSHHIGRSERGEVKRHANEMFFFSSAILALDLSL